MSKSLEALEHLTPRLSPPVTGSHGAQYYEITAGRAKTVGLLKRPELAVAWTTSPPGGKWEEHSHDAKEWVIVWKGNGTFYMNGEPMKLGPSDSLMIEPGIPHSFESHTEVEMIAIIIPTDESWPDV